MSQDPFPGSTIYTGYAIYPAYSLITDITQDTNGVITFSTAHDFTPGEIISLRVAQAYGMRELDNQEVRVLSTTTYTVTIDVNTSTYMPFILATNQQKPAMAVPAASGIIPGQYVATMNLLDAFDNEATT